MVDIITESERAELEAAVKDAETRTSAEIVLMVRKGATEYASVEAMAAATASLALPALLLPFTQIPALMIWIAQLLLFAILAVVLPMLAAGRYFVGKDRVSRDVKAAAQAEFFAHGLRRTSARAAVLVFVALREHRVEILPDDAARDVVEPEAWEKLAARLSEKLAANRMTEGLKDTAHQVADLLGRSLPHEPGSDDELPGVIVH